MSKEPELGQIAFGNPTGDYGTEEWQDALIEYLIEEIKRVYWNKNQKELVDFDDCNLKEIEIRDYDWGEDEKEKTKPNLKFNFSPQEIRCYKYFGRGQSCSLKWKANEWIDWFDKAMEVIGKNEPNYLKLINK